MSIDVRVEADRVKVCGALNQQTVSGGWDQQSATLTGRESLCIDLAGVSTTDTAGLAWLINLLAEARSSECQVHLTNVPSGLIKLAKISDIESLLPLQ